MKKSIAKIVFSLFVLLVICGATPQQAEAINVRLENPYSQTLWAAIVYFEDKSNKWVIQGWWGVEPKSTKNLNFSNSTKKNFVYIHAYNSEATWGASGESIRRVVIGEVFKYFDKESCPAGKNRREVSFEKWYAENNGAVYWRP